MILHMQIKYWSDFTDNKGFHNLKVRSVPRYEDNQAALSSYLKLKF